MADSLMAQSKKTIFTYENWLVFVFFLMQGFVFLDQLVLAFLIPAMLKDIPLTPGQIGLINMAQTIALAIAAPLFGYVSDKVRKRKIFLFIATLGAGIAGLMTLLCHGVNALIVVRVFVGFFEGIAIPIAMSMLRTISSPGRFGRNVGIQNLGCAIIATIAGPIIVTQIAATYGWQYGYVAVGVGCLIVALLIGFFVREAVPKSVEGHKHDIRVFKQVLSNRNVKACLGIGIFYAGAFMTFNAFASLYLVKVGHWSLVQMGTIQSIMGLVIIAWQLVLPILSDKIGRKPVLTGSLALAMLCPILLNLAPSTFVGPGAMILLGGPVLILTTFWMYIIPIESVSENISATAGTIVMGVSYTVCSFIISISGAIADHFGIKAIMLFVAGLYAVATIVSLTALKESNPTIIRKREAASESIKDMIY